MPQIKDIMGGFTTPHLYTCKKNYLVGIGTNDTK